MIHKSDSSEQRSAEAVIRRRLGALEGVALVPEIIRLKNGGTVMIDGVDRAKRVLCEIYAHVGKTRGAQPGKIAKDILKLVAVDKSLGGPHRKLICFGDATAAACLQGKGWLAEVAADLGVEVKVVKLNAQTTARLLAAQKRQVMVNR